MPAHTRHWLAGHDRYDLAAAALFAVLVALVFATVHSYAISNDEDVQQRYGELIVAYYTSGFADTSLFRYANLYLYGGLFDVTAVLTQRLLPAIDPYTIRHVLSALTGVGGIVAAWATARMVAGPRAACITALALALCGPWYGAMFNHTKDIPFAAAMMAATYFLLRTARDLPRPRFRDVLALGLCVGAALGIRVLGLLLLGYIAVAVLARMPSPRQNAKAALDFVVRSSIALMPAIILAYVIMLLAWPWAALAPLNPIRGLLDFGRFQYGINTLLDGRIYQMADVPRWYVPIYLLIKTPLLILVGMAVSFIFMLWPRRHGVAGRQHWHAEGLLIAGIAIFPVFCAVVSSGPAFCGLRHFLFVLPPFAVLAGIGFDGLLTQLTSWRPWLARSATMAIVALACWNAGLMVAMHPYQYLFYNTLVGGLQGASGRYETDYWVNIMPEAVDGLEAYVAALDAQRPRSQRYTVAVCGERLPFEMQANSRLQWVSDWSTAEFFIAPTHMNCDRALGGKEIASIRRIGVTIGVVKDRRALMLQEFAATR